MAVAQFSVTGVKSGTSSFSQGDISGIVAREVMPQLPHSRQEGRVRIAFGREIDKPIEKLFPV